MIIYAPFLRYLSIVAAAYDRMESLLEEDSEEPTDWHSFHETAQAQAAIVVTFTVTVLDSYIHNYACRKLGETFTERHIDKMTLLTKWLIVPQLASGTAVPRDHIGIQLLRDLERARNSVVHLKGANVQDYDHFQATAEKVRGRKKAELQAALNSLYCLGKLGELLYGLDSEEGFAGLLEKLFGKSKRYLVKDAGDE